MPRPVVLLDAGGVLFDNVTEDSTFVEAVGNRFGVNPDALRQRYLAEEARFETGACAGTEALAVALESLGIGRSTISYRQLRMLYRSHVRPNVKLFDFLRMRRQGAAGSAYHLTLANNEAWDWEDEKDRAFGHLRLYDSLSCSWLLGHAKPDPEYFLATLSQTGAEPSEALLIDDNDSCLDSARTLGLAVHEYRGTSDLIAVLKHL